jgi:hypothetical protein
MQTPTKAGDSLDAELRAHEMPTDEDADAPFSPPSCSTTAPNEEAAEKLA